MKTFILVVALAGLTATTPKISAQEVPRDLAPSAAPEKGAGGKLDGQKKTDKHEQNKSHESQTSLCANCSLTYSPVEHPLAEAKEKDGEKPPHDFLYQCYLLATIVGVFGAWVGLFILKRQTNLSAVAAKSASDNAAAANANARAVEAQNATLKDTLAAIIRQAENMQKQTEILRQSIDVVIDKERARLRIRVLDFDPWSEPPTVNSRGVQYKCHVVKLRVSFIGSTTAFVTESSAVCRLLNSSEPKIESIGYRIRIQNLPDEVKPATDILDSPMPIYEEVIYGAVTARLPPNMRSKWMGTDEIVEFDADKIKNGQQFIHVYGFIKYRDIFGKDRETTFRVRWQIIFGLTPKGDLAGQWVKWGPPEANHET